MFRLCTAYCLKKSKISVSADLKFISVIIWDSFFGKICICLNYS